MIVAAGWEVAAIYGAVALWALLAWLWEIYRRRRSMRIRIENDHRERQRKLDERPRLMESKRLENLAYATEIAARVVDLLLGIQDPAKRPYLTRPDPGPGWVGDPHADACQCHLCVLARRRR